MRCYRCGNKKKKYSCKNCLIRQRKDYKRRVSIRKKKGLCPRCGGNAGNGTIYCAFCTHRETFSRLSEAQRKRAEKELKVGKICAICKEKKPLVVDHIDDKFRGLICSGCNKGIGFLPNAKILRAAIIYVGRTVS